MRVGDAVAPERTLVIPESMKMEIPVTRRIPAPVLEPLVAEGEAVAEGRTWW